MILLHVRQKREIDLYESHKDRLQSLNVRGDLYGDFEFGSLRSTPRLRLERPLGFRLCRLSPTYL